MEYFSTASVGYAVGVMVVAFITYLKGKSEGRNEATDMAIERTIEYLRINNMIRWQYDSDGEICLLDINGKSMLDNE